MMTDDEYREREAAIDARYWETTQRALCRRQKNPAFIDKPALIHHTSEGIEAAREHDEAIKALESEYYALYLQ